MNNIALVTVSGVMIFVGIAILANLSYQTGSLDFLRAAHWWSLVILLIAGILTWLAMVWMLKPDKLEINKDQWISFGFTVVISILWWARYAYTVSQSSGQN